MKNDYKELRKNLRNDFKGATPYKLMDSVGVWILQSNMTPVISKVFIICKIFGGVPYPYQKADREVVLSYLKNNKYKQFKKDFKV